MADDASRSAPRRSPRYPTGLPTLSARCRRETSLFVASCDSQSRHRHAGQWRSGQGRHRGQRHGPSVPRPSVRRRFPFPHCGGWRSPPPLARSATSDAQSYEVAEQGRARVDRYTEEAMSRWRGVPAHAGRHLARATTGRRHTPRVRVRGSDAAPAESTAAVPAVVRVAGADPVERPPRVPPRAARVQRAPGPSHREAPPPSGAARVSLPAGRRSRAALRSVSAASHQATSAASARPRFASLATRRPPRPRGLRL